MTPPSKPADTTLARYLALEESTTQGLRGLACLGVSLLKVPLVAIYLADPIRQGVFSCVASGQAPKQGQVFAHFASLAEGPQIVDDLRKHESLANEPSVRGEPGFRSLVCCKITGESGLLGALCGFDTEPQPPDPAQRAQIELLVQQIALAIETRNQLRLLSERHSLQLERLQLLEGVVQAGHRVALIATDTYGIIRWFNQGAEVLLGYRASEVVGRHTPLLFLVPEELESEAAEVSARLGREVMGLDVLWQPALTGDTAEREWTFRNAAREPLAVGVVVSPVRREDGAMRGFVLAALDITERKARDRMKTEFIATVSHELRTPLTGILASVKLLALGDTPRDAESDEALQIATSSADRLLQLVNEILDLQALEYESSRFHFELCDAWYLAEEAVRIGRFRASQAGVTLSLEGVADRWAIKADPPRIAQVFSHLIGNAVRASSAEGTVIVQVAPVGARVRFQVIDEGAQVPEHLEQRYVFERFARSPTGRSGDGRSGSLGLSIARLIVERHGGCVGFENLAERGTCFFFELPIWPGTGEPVSSRPRSSSSWLR
jgi:signal transduction histidine kinase